MSIVGTTGPVGRLRFFVFVVLSAANGMGIAADRLVPWFPGTVIIDSDEQTEAEKSARERTLEERESQDSDTLQRLLPSPAGETPKPEPERKTKAPKRPARKERPERPPATLPAPVGPVYPGQVVIDSAEQAEAEKRVRQRALEQAGDPASTTPSLPSDLFSPVPGDETTDEKQGSDASERLPAP
jgi:hypothetical protein